MKQLVTLCIVFSLAGCASKKMPKPPQPVNGQCGIIQDACILGDPSGTGDTTPPYGWMCLGRYGGTNDPCSVPTARIERGEVFAGQNALEKKVKAVGPLRGLLTVVDWTVEETEYSHADNIREYILGMGIPEENLRIIPDWLDSVFSDDYDPVIRENTLVFNFPNTWVIGGVSDASLDILRRHDFLAVAAAGNTETFPGRNLWYPNHPEWKRDGAWESSFAAFATGKVIIAKYANRLDDAEHITAHEGNVKCGLAKEYCYSIVFSEYPGGGTSSASARLSALTFYLFQLWNGPKEVVNVLNVCAEDIGEPGIDEEFGRGIVSVVCDTVRNRERSAVASSMQVSHAASPVLNHMTGQYDRQLTPQSLSTPLVKWFRPFYAVRGHNLETITGHLGGQISFQGTDLFVSGGTNYTPLGVYSSLRPVVRTPFMEFGTRRTVFSRNKHTVSLLGTYGYSQGNGLFAQMEHLGVQYQRQLIGGTLSLYAGHRTVRGRIGILGHREAGADLVPFTDRNPEVRVSFSLF